MAKKADLVEEVNLTRAQWKTNSFFFLYSTAKACLFPFLTVYLRYLGLSAVQTGLVLAIRSCLNVWCATLWTSCAKKFNKQRTVLMVSLYCLMGVFIALTFVPPSDRYTGLKYCHMIRGKAWNVSDYNTDIDISLFTTQSEISTSSKSFLMMKSTVAPTSKIQTTTVASLHKIKTTNSPKNTATPTKNWSLKPTVTPQAGSVGNGVAPKHHRKHKKPTKHHKPATPTPVNVKSGILDVLSEEDVKLLKDLGLSLDEIKQMTEDELEQYLLTALHSDEGHKVKRHAGHEEVAPPTRNISSEDEGSKTAIWQKFKALVDKVRFKIISSENRTFALVLILVVIGGLFGSPVDKLVDNLWFEFLDNIDFVEKYGQHALWGAIGVLFAPTIITTIVDHVPCILPLFHLYNFTIHVFAFCTFCAVVFILSLFYPISTLHKKPKMKALIGKGIKTVCNNAHAAVLTFTMFMVGLTQASAGVFLFWKIQDLGGGEMPMGIAVTAAAFFEIIVFFLNKGIIRKIGHGGSVLVALVLMIGRLIFYGFLMNPWLAIAGEAFYGFSNALLWHSVHSYPDFRLNALATDRSAADTINNIYHAFGFSTGSIVSGIVCSIFGIDRLFQGAAGLLFLWTVIFAIIMKCVKKKRKVHYNLLLQSDNEDSSDEDWLEVALKEVK